MGKPKYENFTFEHRVKLWSIKGLEFELKTLTSRFEKEDIETMLPIWQHRLNVVKAEIGFRKLITPKQYNTMNLQLTQAQFNLIIEGLNAIKEKAGTDLMHDSLIDMMTSPLRTQEDFGKLIKDKKAKFDKQHQEKNIEVQILLGELYKNRSQIIVTE